MQNFSRKIRNKGFLIIAGFIFLSYGFINTSSNRDFQIARNMDIFFSMIREINLFYVDDPNPEKLIENAINGVLEGLDPYTTFIPESEKESYETMTTGRYGGIGALIRQRGDYVMISEPYEGFPAQTHGLKAGDVITAINGTSLNGKPVGEVSDMLRGQSGSTITLTIKRTGHDELLTKDIIRKEVKISNVAWYGKVADDIGYIQFNGFTENAHQEVRHALNDMKNNYNVSKLILDVRGNPGGLLMEAVNVTNLFVEKGQEIVSTKGKVTQWDHTYRARNKPFDKEIPVVILVGRSSASAAEIVAGAFQDLDRGVVIGQRTFGKGLIQTTRQLSYNSQLKITTAKYYTPSGRCIQSVDFSEDNNYNKIPDSQINEFKTRNGRIVYDGGGIIPDIHVYEETPAPVVINLYARNFIFDFATKYASENPSIPAVSEFMINDDDYNNFLAFIEEADFDYQTQTEIQVAQLLNAAKNEGYYDASESIFDELAKKITHDKQRDLETHRDQIKSFLREEIVSRYYYRNGRIEASIEGDPNLEKAIEILNNQPLYEAILKGAITHAGSL